MAYSKEVLDHYENPRNVGTMDDNDRDVGTGMWFSNRIKLFTNRMG